MKNKVLIVSAREYLKNVRKITFWLATLFFPVFMIIIGFISGYSGKTLENKIKNDANSAKSIQVFDQAQVINPSKVTAPFELVDSFDTGLEKVKKTESDALFVIPKDVVESNKIEIYEQSRGILSRNRYDEVAKNLIKQSILEEIKDPDKIKLFNASLSVNVTTFKGGAEFNDKYERLIIPIASVAIYFLLISFGNGYLLMSVSEEKENRMIEVVLTSIKPSQLILGKIIGQVATVFTQLITLIGLAGLAFYVTNLKSPIPIDFSSVHFGIGTILMGLFYIICGFLILGNIMVGVGAAMPTYKEAQSFSSVFIIFSVLPVYFFSILLADPSGTVGMITSYFPFTAPMILLFRYSLGELSVLETIISSLILILYAGITYVIAYKLFEFGSLEYNKKISFGAFVRNLKK